jgi:thiol-disulfide isomerase/thioredoxin
MFARIFAASAAALLVAGAALSQDASEAAAKKPSLTVGQKAPAISVEKWVKGAPVASFEKGKTNVVEFWATWCGPCVASMPHLSALQRQYKDKGVTIIGVTTEDPNNDLAAVEAMVKQKGEGMDYTVAWDSGTKMHEAWMRAAGQNGIPCSFVVDGTGTIAYIGHPMFLDMPMEQLAAGKWDLQKGNALIADAEAKLSAIYKAVGTESKDAAAKIAEFESKFPAFASAVASLKFGAYLTAGDFQSAYAWGGKLVDEAIAKKDAAQLNDIAWRIVDPEAKWEKRDLDLALRAAEKGVSLTQEKDGAVLDTLARVYFLKGDTKKAMELQTKAIDVSKGDMKKSLEKTLEEYKAKAAQ